MQLDDALQSKSQQSFAGVYPIQWCERTKLISKVESKSQLLGGCSSGKIWCERTKLISKVESKSQLIWNSL